MKASQGNGGANQEVEDFAPEPLVLKPKQNAFAFLDGSDDESSSPASESPANPPESPIAVAKPEPPKKAGKQRKLKKQTRKAKARANSNSSLDSDDLDKYLAEVRLRDQHREGTQTPEPTERTFDLESVFDDDMPPIDYADANFLYFTTAKLKRCLPLLSVGDIKNLDADTELRSLFGDMSLEAIEDAETTTYLAALPEVLAQYKKIARLTRGWGMKDRRSVPGTARKLLLTRIKDDWLPTATRPLTLEDMTDSSVVASKAYKDELLFDALTIESIISENPEITDLSPQTILELKVANEKALGIRYFKFGKQFSMQDRLANSKFYASVVMTADPESLMQLFSQNPYHVETLLQLSMIILRQGHDKSSSNSLVERALFVFDRCLDKRLHEMLLKGSTELIRLPYETFVNRQFYLTLFRTITALSERSTFFTALNYCKFLLSLAPAEDPLGVRYFIDHYAILAEEYDYLIKLVKSPLTTTYAQWYTPGLGFSLALAYLRLGRPEDAKKALELAYASNKLCAHQLLEAVGYGECPGSVKKHALALEEISAATYIVRAKALWKEPQEKQFLDTEITRLSSKSDKKSPSAWFGSLFKKPENKKDDLPFNLLRFVILSGESLVMAKLPGEVFDRDDVFEYDVLPPKDTMVDYNVFTGVEDAQKQTDSLLDYIDHNLIGAIVQNRTAEEVEGFGQFVDEED